MTVSFSDCIHVFTDGDSACIHILSVSAIGFLQGFNFEGSPWVHFGTGCVQAVSRDLLLEFQPEVQCCMSDAGCVKGFCPRNSGFAHVTVLAIICVQ